VRELVLDAGRAPCRQEYRNKTGDSVSSLINRESPRVSCRKIGSIDGSLGWIEQIEQIDGLPLANYWLNF